MSTEAEKEPFYLLVAGCNCIFDYQEACKIMDLCVSHKKDSEIIVLTEKTKNKENVAEKWAREHGYECITKSVDHAKTGNITFKRDRELHLLAQHQTQRACLVFWDGWNKQVADNFELAWECQNQLAIYYTKGHTFIKQKEVPDLCDDMFECEGFPRQCNDCKRNEVKNDQGISA